MSNPPRRYPNLRPNPETLKVTPLEAGEMSRPVRVRAAVEVHVWLGTMTATQVGEVLARAKDAQEATQEAASGSAQGAQAQEPEMLPEAAAQLVEVVTLGTLPPRDIEPKPHHTPILDALRGGGTLTRAPGEVWRLVGGGERGRTIKAETVRVMLRDGWLSHADPIPLKDRANEEDQGEGRGMQQGAQVS